MVNYPHCLSPRPESQGLSIYIHRLFTSPHSATAAFAGELQHRKTGVVIMPTLSLLLASPVHVVGGATNGDKVGIMTTLGFACTRWQQAMYSRTKNSLLRIEKFRRIVRGHRLTRMRGIKLPDSWNTDEICCQGVSRVQICVYGRLFTRWGRNKMAGILQTLFFRCIFRNGEIRRQNNAGKQRRVSIH